MISIQNLSKSFGKNDVLKGVNVQFEQGGVYGIVGENGSGKTTLFRCLAGLEDYEGTINAEFDPIKNDLGFLQTDPYFFSKITGREYLQLFCNARNMKRVDFDQKNVFGLPLDQYAINYSTGMKKKLALTAILIQNNKFYILDEPYNGVDIQSNMVITEIIHKLKALGKTIIISSHIFSTLNDTCDEIHLLKNGLFVQRVLKQDFQRLENEMKDFSVGNIIENLGLS